MRVHITTVIVIWIGVTLASCSPGESDRVYIYVPKNYTGWVNIIYDDKNSKNEALHFADGTVYFVSNPPAAYRVKNKPLDSRRYAFQFFLL